MAVSGVLLGLALFGHSSFAWQCDHGWGGSEQCMGSNFDSCEMSTPVLGSGSECDDVDASIATFNHRQYGSGNIYEGCGVDNTMSTGNANGCCNCWKFKPFSSLSLRGSVQRLNTSLNTGVPQRSQALDQAFLQSVSNQMDLHARPFTASGVHFAQGFTTQNAGDINAKGMAADCENINLNKKLSASFRADVFASPMKGFFYKCEKVGNKNKYWFTISSGNKSALEKLCNNGTEYPIVYDAQHDTYWRDEPFACDSIVEPEASLNMDDDSSSQLLVSVSNQMNLPPKAYTASGIHFAQGFTTNDAEDIFATGMAADCENINQNKKLSATFRADVFASPMKGFFYRCEKVGDKNKYWFTVSSDSKSDLEKICNKGTEYPIVYDAQHDTYWQDEPFACESIWVAWRP